MPVPASTGPQEVGLGPDRRAPDVCGVDHRPRLAGPERLDPTGVLTFNPASRQAEDVDAGKVAAILQEYQAVWDRLGSR
jgi:hypothetical protein